MPNREALYNELEDYLLCLTPKQRMRLICRFYLKFSPDDMARLENTSRQAIFLSINQAKRRIKEFQNHDDIIAAINEVFRRHLY